MLDATLTHAGDARPLFWPLSGHCFEGPVSYWWDRDNHARPFALVEHAALLVATVQFLSWVLAHSQRFGYCSHPFSGKVFRGALDAG